MTVIKLLVQHGANLMHPDNVRGLAVSASLKVPSFCRLQQPAPLNPCTAPIADAEPTFARLVGHALRPTQHGRTVMDIAREQKQSGLLAELEKINMVRTNKRKRSPPCHVPWNPCPRWEHTAPVLQLTWSKRWNQTRGRSPTRNPTSCLILPDLH